MNTKKIFVISIGIGTYMKTLEINTKNKKRVDTLIKKDTPTVILFHMNGCSHCTALYPVWKEVTGEFEKLKGIDLAEVEFASIGLLPDNIRKNIAGFPTIQIIQKGKPISEYMGDRSKETIIEFINKYKLPEATKPKKPSATKKPSVKKPKT
jgi:thioredoxin-like negative regulator of GroEL